MAESSARRPARPRLRARQPLGAGPLHRPRPSNRPRSPRRPRTARARRRRRRPHAPLLPGPTRCGAARPWARSSPSSARRRRRRTRRPTASRAFVDPRQLRAGSDWRAYSTAEGRLERFELALAGRGELRLERDADGWRRASASSSARCGGGSISRPARRRARGVDRARRQRTADARLRHGRRAAVGPRLHPRPAAGRPLPHALRGGLARGRVPRDRNACWRSPTPRTRGRSLEAYRFGDGAVVLRRRGPAAAEDVPALAAALLARHLALHEPPLPSGPQGLPAALRRRLRRAGGHAGARHRHRHGDLRRLGRRRRQGGEGPASEPLPDRLPAPVALRQRHPLRQPCAPGRHRRLRRRDRPRHGAAPRLPRAAERALDRSALAHSGAGGADPAARLDGVPHRADRDARQPRERRAGSGRRSTPWRRRAPRRRAPQCTAERALK